MRQIETIDFSDAARFYQPGDVPALLKGWCNHWAATRKWTLDFFQQAHGDQVVAVSNYRRATYGQPGVKRKVKLRDYISLAQGHVSPDLELGPDDYLAGWHFINDVPDLLQDIEIPPCFQNNILDDVNGAVVHYDSTSLFIGHGSTNSPLHTDSFGVSVWLATIVGRKTVKIVPPEDYQNIKNGMDAFSDEFSDRMQQLGIPVYTVELHAGDILYIPPGHWHQVVNHGVTVAISTNFVGFRHFLPFEQQLRARVVSPLLKLVRFKKEVLKRAAPSAFSAQSMRHFGYIEKEEAYLDHLQSSINADRELLKALREDENATAGD